jgi:hypothetical protein
MNSVLVFNGVKIYVYTYIFDIVKELQTTLFVKNSSEVYGKENLHKKRKKIIKGCPPKRLICAIICLSVKIERYITSKSHRHT